ncbi:hypothetical protein J6590_027538 [Homalodisca vitripennis]|nr:hypothetical protein J6590_027538 [Homalodisca vitripennis]
MILRLYLESGEKHPAWGCLRGRTLNIVRNTQHTAHTLRQDLHINPSDHCSHHFILSRHFACPALYIAYHTVRHDKTSHRSTRTSERHRVQVQTGQWMTSGSTSRTVSDRVLRPLAVPSLTPSRVTSASTFRQQKPS